MAAHAGEAIAQYVNVLENVFVAIRGRGVQWSADDRARVERWHQLGVPLPTVVSAIETRAKAWRYVNGHAADLPIGLRSYERAVLSPRSYLPRQTPVDTEHASPPIDSAAVAHGGRHELADPQPTDQLAALVDSVPGTHADVQDPALAQAYRRAGASLTRSLHGDVAATREGIDDAALHDSVQRARRLVAKVCQEGLGKSERERILGEVERRLGREPAMSATARKRRHGLLVERLLSEHHGVVFPTIAGEWRPTR